MNFIFQRILGFNNTVKNSVHFTSHVYNGGHIEIAKDVRYSFAVSGKVNISVSKDTSLHIGEGTIFACNICIRTANHDLMDRKKYVKGSVQIGKNCWLGHGAVILPGVCLGDNVTVGANSVVTKSFPSDVVIGGVPAKILKKITESK